MCAETEKRELKLSRQKTKQNKQKHKGEGGRLEAQNVLPDQDKYNQQIKLICTVLLNRKFTTNRLIPDQKVVTNYSSVQIKIVFRKNQNADHISALFCKRLLNILSGVYCRQQYTNHC